MYPVSGLHERRLRPARHRTRILKPTYVNEKKELRFFQANINSVFMLKFHFNLIQTKIQFEFICVHKFTQILAPQTKRLKGIIDTIIK